MSLRSSLFHPDALIMVLWTSVPSEAPFQGLCRMTSSPTTSLSMRQLRPVRSFVLWALAARSAITDDQVRRAPLLERR